MKRMLPLILSFSIISFVACNNRNDNNDCGQVIPFEKDYAYNPSDTLLLFNAFNDIKGYVKEKSDSFERFEIRVSTHCGEDNAVLFSCDTIDLGNRFKWWKVEFPRYDDFVLTITPIVK